MTWQLAPGSALAKTDHALEELRQITAQAFSQLEKTGIKYIRISFLKACLSKCHFFQLLCISALHRKLSFAINHFILGTGLMVSVGKVLSLLARGPEAHPQSPCENSGFGGMHL